MTVSNARTQRLAPLVVVGCAAAAVLLAPACGNDRAARPERSPSPPVTSLENRTGLPSQPDLPTVGAVDDGVVVVPPTTSPRPIVTIPGVSFAFDAADLAPSAIAILESVLDDLLSAQRVEVTGHTDSSGTTAHNESLAVARAEAVARWLEGQGVPGGRIRVAGAGSSRPIANNDDERGRAANRRVEISAE